MRGRHFPIWRSIDGILKSLNQRDDHIDSGGGGGGMGMRSW